MTDVLKVLNNIRSLRVIARELPLEQLEGILEKVQLVVAEKKEELLKVQQEENERQERIAKYKELLKQEGITADELAEILGSDVVRKKKNPVRQNINTLMKMGWLKLGQVKVEHQKLFKCNWIKVNPYLLLKFNYFLRFHEETHFYGFSFFIKMIENYD